MDSLDVDVLVVGSGAAGMTAAIVSARAGLEVLLVEKTPYLGGTTAVSGGGLWVPNNHHMKSIGVHDNLELATNYLKSVMGPLFDQGKIAAYLHWAPRMVQDLEASTQVKFHGAPVPDYEPGAPGWTVGRSILSVTFDGRQLGDDLHLLRQPLAQMGVLGMQVGLADVDRLRNAGRSLPDFLYSAKLLLRYGIEKSLFGRARRLVNGNALAARLLSSARAVGVQIWNNAAAQQLTMENGTAVGMIVQRQGRACSVRARRGIILATGGFGANAEMRALHIPMAEYGWSLQSEGNQGDGIQMGVQVGGKLVTDNSANAIWVPVSSMLNKRHERVVFPHAMLDRHSPGSIIVNTSGARFTNEGFHYQHFGNLSRTQGLDRCYLIGDHTLLRKYGMGLARARPFPIRSFLRSGYLVGANSIGELARKLGIDADTLDKTVARFNHFAEQGVDPDFHRGADKYSAFMGDALHKPNPSLGPLVTPPYYAVELRPGEFCTISGLETDANARVIGAGGLPIKHLYVAGNDMNTPWRGAYPGGGSGLGPAMTFGYVAATHIINAGRLDS
jgi:succinate dehydrogenase/fumarate reductase flavoprotein subunit